MRVLHILRSQPDEMVREFIGSASEGNESLEVPLYLDNVDYDELVEEIFKSDQVISWW